MYFQMSRKDDLEVIIEEKIKETVELIREKSVQGKFLKISDLPMEPLNLTNEEIDRFIVAIENISDYEDIISLKGKKEKYYYSKIKMTDTYAKMVYRVEENDLLKLMVETVRRESEIYPRPTAITLFYEKPFSFNKEMIMGFLMEIKEEAEYRDLKETTASNGAMYLYSTKHLTFDHAKALTEWIEVLQYENP